MKRMKVVAAAKQRHKNSAAIVAASLVLTPQ
jgi:hypothetical protein